MESEVHFLYKGGMAYFRLSKEASGIYFAHLTNYDGATENSPPKEITIIKGIRCWKGSAEDEMLLNQLGSFIENPSQSTSTT